ncbi:pteridine reductase [Ferrimonas marina]|uniref:Pteridine reductase n=1 Tax=Ferrimonas marina TaxID=299255 RepID=A0A1M5NJU2_9GAMM|nr:pteridine reductase [Ferrimonas marina]SHG89772.1 pteridine reductase [Ferrimonas marina]
MPTKVALTTGSARRIGAAINQMLHQRGFNLVIHCNSSAAEAQALAEQFNALRPDSAVVIQGSLSDPQGIPGLAEQTLAPWGRLDLLVNNASAFFPTPIGQIDDAAWHSLVGSNMQGPLLLSQALAPALTQTQGGIVNLLDVHAQSPLKGHTLYCMAKAALSMMTRSLALELAPEVRVNAVAPGAILWPETGGDAAAQQGVLDQVPLGRLGTPEDIAQAVGFLALDAHYITGQILAVDGGRSIAPLEGA